MNPRCPVCRYDIRLQAAPVPPPNEGDRLHTNEE
jgi:hypothetical protein